MSKFKVGDKVLTPFGIGEIIVFNYFLEKDKSYKVRLNYKMDDTHAYEYGKPPLLNFTEKEIKTYKSAHEKLLDLGWVIDEDDKNETRIFYYKNKRVIRINRINKTCLTAIYIDLQLAKILVRYLEELE